MRVSILVVTRDRPSELRRLLSSMRALRYRRIDVPTLDLVVVDNAPTPEGYDPDELTALAGMDTQVVHEPRLGIPFARNTALRARHPAAAAVVFVDDDITVTPSWLEHLLVAMIEHAADFVAGPAIQRIEADTDPAVVALLSALRSERPPDGAEIDCAATGNLLVRPSWLERQDHWLDEGFGLAGGSDIEWTRRSHREGAVIVHADRAQTWHHLSRERLTRRWVRRRIYRVGQGAAEQARLDGAGRARLLADAARAAGSMTWAFVAALAAREPSAHLHVTARGPWLVGWIATVFGASRYREYRTVTSEASASARCAPDRGPFPTPTAVSP